MTDKVAYVTLGCKVNQYETQAFRDSLTAEGFTEATPGERADVTVVNACVVTQNAERESRAAIRRALKRNPGSRVIATGCLTDKSKAMLADMPGVTLVANTEKNQVPTVAARRAVGPPPSSVTGMRIRGFKGRSRAFVKVQDGCALSCSFCIIPKVRGHLRSRPISDILAEAEELAERGFRELVLTGVHLGHFGRGRGERERLTTLLEKLAALDGVERIRLSSIESVELKPDILDVLCSSPKFCPHFHLPLQSGSDRILEAMRRRYTVAEFMAGVEELWRRFDRPSLSTDVIIGFPGETQRDFQDTLAVMRAAGFGRSHVFSYSDREGTDATALRDKTPPTELRRRTHEAIATGERLARRYSQLFAGQVVRVLAERGTKRSLAGYSDRYVRLHFDGSSERLGELFEVRVTEVHDDGEASAELLEKSAGMTLH